MKLSLQETKELIKYTKFFALKSTQVIVQSRMGEKCSTPCTQNTDWVMFNLHIIDNQDVACLAKQVVFSELVTPLYPVCVEISLQTSEGDSMTLENWCLNLLPDQCDPTMRNITNLYSRMGLLLKSLMSVTRVTPAYKLSRRQGPDSYVICYRIHSEQPQVHALGEGYKSTKIGQICTPIGTLLFSVDYRTKMTISPTQTGKNNTIMVKSDHFNSNSNARKHRKSEDISDLTKPMKPGPFADPKLKKSVEPVQLPEVTRLLAMGKCKPRVVVKPTSESESSDISRIADEEVANKKESSPSRLLMTSSRISTASNLKSVGEDYWMKELNAPFATRGPMGELMQFYKQCKKSPPLQSPQKNPSQEEITRMIEMYESQLPEYEALVQSFCESPDNN